MKAIVFVCLMSAFSAWSGDDDTIVVSFYDQANDEQLFNVRLIGTHCGDTIFTDSTGFVRLPKYPLTSYTIQLDSYFSKTLAVNTHVSTKDSLQVKLQPFIGDYSARYHDLWKHEMDSLNKRFAAFGTQEVNCVDDSTGVVLFPDSDAKFPGKPVDLQRFIVNVIRYPQQALENDVSGRVYISFYVEPDGQISNIKIEKGVSELLNEECIRVIKNMPLWIPGLCRGQFVRTKMLLPIVFAI